MAKKIKKSNGALYSPWQLLNAANAHYALSCVLTDKVPSQPHIVAKPHTGSEIAASATNRILALELYFKALLVGHNADLPLTHDLVVLYQALPKESRDEIQDEFSQLNNSEHAGERLVELIMCFQLTPELPSDWPSKAYDSSPKDTSFAGVLERNRAGFVLSRYLFEQARFDRETFYLYEFWRLALICGVVCNILENNLQNCSTSYKRGFDF